MALDIANSAGCAWGDYDNDGYLDLFVVNATQKSFLYHNNGAAAFTKVTEGSLVNDGGPGVVSVGCSWGDYDNDGFLDLFVANGGGHLAGIQHDGCSWHQDRYTALSDGVGGCPR